VTGYDSAYAGESAFVNISPGQTLNFQVFFANTGTTTWSRGTGTQVDLAACLEDKTTCNAQDATEASWNTGWLSATRYASTVQTTTAPGALGTFSYNITAPVGATNGTYRFNGDLVLSSTGEKIHPDGYYQDATIGGAGGGAATLTNCVDNTSGLGCSGTTSGGDSVTLTGTGITCTPAFPAVSFGGANAVVTSCGSTSVNATTPAHAPGAVAVTLTNSGAAASNALTYQYVDTTKPTFTGQSTTGNFVNVTFSEPVCSAPAASNTAAADWTVRNVSASAALFISSDNIPDCTAAGDASVTSATIFLGSNVPPGAFVEVTLNPFPAGTTTNTHIVDLAANAIKAPQAQTATAGSPETTAPTIVSATGAVGSQIITVNFSEPVYCTAGWTGTTASGQVGITDNNTATTDPTATGVSATNLCGTDQTNADTSFDLSTGTTLPAGTTYTLTLTPGGTIKDIPGNNLATQSVIFTTGAADFTPPTMIDARLTFNAGPSTDFTDALDQFTVTFSEKMNGATTGSIGIQDQDGTVGTINCASNANCVWDTNVTTMTVTLTSAPVFPGGANGTTPGMQIPFNITSLTVIKDTSLNPPNVLGSSDRLVDYE